MKKGSTSLVSREIQVKIILGYHYRPTIMTKIKKIDNNNWWWGCGIIGNPYSLLKGIQNNIATMENSFDSFLNKDKHTSYDLAIPLLGI